VGAVVAVWVYVAYPSGPKIVIVEYLLDAPRCTEIPHCQRDVLGRVHQLRPDGLCVNEKVQLRLRTK
jgi:hypothetical protein